MSNFINIRPVGVEVFHADGRTDMTKLIVAFRNFAHAPINFLPSVVIQAQFLSQCRFRLRLKFQASVMLWTKHL